MKRRLAVEPRKKTKIRAADPQLAEFEKRDLGDDIRRSGTGRVVRKETANLPQLFWMRTSSNDCAKLERSAVSVIRRCLR